MPIRLLPTGRMRIRFENRAATAVHLATEGGMVSRAAGQGGDRPDDQARRPRLPVHRPGLSSYYCRSREEVKDAGPSAPFLTPDCGREYHRLATAGDDCEHGGR